MKHVLTKENGSRYIDKWIYISIIIHNLRRKRETPLTWETPLVLPNQAVYSTNHLLIDFFQTSSYAFLKCFGLFLWILDITQEKKGIGKKSKY